MKPRMLEIVIIASSCVTNFDVSTMEEVLVHVVENNPWLQFFTHRTHVERETRCNLSKNQS